MELFELGTFVRLATVTIGSFLGTLVLWGISRRIYRRLTEKKDYFGDRITGQWVRFISENERDIAHSISWNRCNYCGQKNIAQQRYEPLLGSSPMPLECNNTRDYLCEACGAKFNAAVYRVAAKVTREPTDPIPELGRPATHAAVSRPWASYSEGWDGIGNLIKAAPKISRRRAIEHTRAKVSAAGADR